MFQFSNNRADHRGIGISLILLGLCIVIVVGCKDMGKKLGLKGDKGDTGTSGQTIVGIGSVSGKIVDPDGNPLASTTISYSSLSGTSGTDGDFLISNVPLGEIKLTASKSGYMNGYKTQLLNSTGTVSVGNITLYRVDQQLLEANRLVDVGGRVFAQSFKPSNNSLRVVRLSPGLDVSQTIEIRQDSGGDPAGTAMASAQITKISEDWSQAVFSPAVSVSPGTSYWIVIASDTSGSCNFPTCYAVSDLALSGAIDKYTNGVAKQWGGIGWVSAFSASNTDLKFIEGY